MRLRARTLPRPGRARVPHGRQRRAPAGGADPGAVRRHRHIDRAQAARRTDRHLRRHASRPWADARSGLHGGHRPLHRPAARDHAGGQSRRAQIRVLDAPVAGGEPGATDASLSIMVGRDAEDFAAAKPVFEALGRTITHCGPNGRGQTVKAASQLVLAISLQACAEAVVFLEKSGVDLEAALDVIGGGMAGSTALARKKANLLKRDYTPSFRMGLHHKDPGIVTDTARAIGAAIPLGSVAAQLVASAVARGEADLDHSALLRGVELLSGYDHEEQ
ncbi:NAD binding domain of 6-phosphogluconate dehydrogenase [Streptomyces sp. 3214.6]|nr:NAD binding domain of 6-phosphogluconate dehydrogenase [Streptomyces sp. 3214.6]